MIRGGLFTQYFLQDGVQELDAYRAIDPAWVIGAGDRLRGLWATLATFRRPSEAETETDFILSALVLLGWHHLPQQEPGRGRRDLADALLFLSEADIAKARRLPSDQRFRHGVVLTEREARAWPIAEFYLRLLAAYGARPNHFRVAGSGGCKHVSLDLFSELDCCI
jgi:hypothetical protein